MKVSKKFLLSSICLILLIQLCGVAQANLPETSKNKYLVLNIHEAMRVIHRSVFITQEKHDSKALKSAAQAWKGIRSDIKALCDSMETTSSRLEFLPFDIAGLIAGKFRTTSKKIHSRFEALDSIFTKLDTELAKNGKYVNSDVDTLVSLLEKWSISRHKAMDVEHLPVSNTSFNGLSFLETAYHDRSATGKTLVEALPEISKLADSLEKKTDSINRWVSQNVKFQPYFGLLKGAVSTMREKSGNHADTASLLSGLLKASGFKTRYVLGSINYSENSLKKLIHFSGSSLSNVLAQTGLTYRDGALYTVWVQALSGGRWVNLLPDSKSDGDIAEVFGTCRELPDSFRYTVDVALSRNGHKSLSVAKGLPAYYFSNKSASISFRPKDEKERSVLTAVYAMNTKVVRKLLPFAFTSSLTIPSFLVDVSPEIKIDNKSFSPDVSLSMGEPIVLTLSIKLNNSLISKCSHMVAAGGYASFRMDFAGLRARKPSTEKASLAFMSFDTDSIFNNTFPITEDSLKELDIVSKDYSRENLNLTLTNLETHDRDLFFSPLFSENAVSVSFRHFDIFDVPFLMVQSGVSIDVQKDAFFVSGKNKAIFIREKGGFGNMAEHRVLSRFCSGGDTPVSAFRIINRLAKKGVPILTLTSEKMFSDRLTELPVEYAVARDIKNALRHKAKVVIPSQTENPESTGYIVTRAESAGYFLSGGKAGGLADSMKSLGEGYKQTGQNFQNSGSSVLGGSTTNSNGSTSVNNNSSLAQKLNIGGTVNLGSSVNVKPKFLGGFIGVVLAIIIIVVLVIAIA